MTKAERAAVSRRSADLGLAVVLGGFAGGLGLAMWPLAGGPSAGLGDAVLARLERSGVENPVTAVLMNFRAYDTLLELTVLLIALIGLRSVPIPVGIAPSPPPVVLKVLNRLLVPFLLLFAAYLLWAGSVTSGGAFQAGAVLGAAGVMIALSGEPPPVTDAAARAAVALAVGVFAMTGVVLVAVGRAPLEFPTVYAKALILTIESAATLSIAATLLALLLGGGPAGARGSRRAQ